MAKKKDKARALMVHWVTREPPDKAIVGSNLPWSQSFVIAS